MIDNETLYCVYDALQMIVDNKECKALNYAVGYADYGLSISDPKELRIQCLYVLSNMTHWRGDKAKEVISTLKTFIETVNKTQTSDPQ